ncbi:MAG: hypothetical protein OEM05_14945 [Myxococcales bacterium]|nr:hypothetical protein [Myxococcales bacterium]
MRVALAVAVGVILLPMASAANPYQNQCYALTRQIDRYTIMLERAEKLDNEMWVERTGDHVGRLVQKRAAMCPEYAKDDTAMRAFAALVKLGAKAALAYFTFGAF